MKKYRWSLIFLGIWCILCIYSELSKKPSSKPQWEGPDLSKGQPLGFNPTTRTYRYRTYSIEPKNHNRKIIKDNSRKSRYDHNDFTLEEAIQYYMD